MLELRGPTPIGELAEALGMERTTLTRNLALLEARALGRHPPRQGRRALAYRRDRREGKGDGDRPALPAWRKAQAAAVASIGAAGVAALHSLAQSTIR